ncbi:hypothetical protein [Paraliobacillus salinarum]|uniref:hypothetical protein n=1 Tax=Paraliobacillus salinarum TaxID=1158996 RepID=UPI0015F6AD7A|nr:hypothetical protein [Paraliobacillus salinarum]
MGYILPVTNYQYSNYHARVTQPKRDPYPIEQLYPIQLDMDYQKNIEDQATDISELSTKHKRHNAKSALASAHTAVTEQTYTDLTGTGKFVNQVI